MHMKNYIPSSQRRQLPRPTSEEERVQPSSLTRSPEFYSDNIGNWLENAQALSTNHFSEPSRPWWQLERTGDCSEKRCSNYTRAVCQHLDPFATWWRNINSNSFPRAAPCRLKACTWSIFYHNFSSHAVMQIPIFTFVVTIHARHMNVLPCEDEYSNPTAFPHAAKT